jgi:hypothetical protein
MTGVSYHDDVPAAQPEFAFPVLAKAVAELLVEQYDAARVVAIHGPWGSGKTTLMYAIRSEIKGRLGDKAVLLDFNAWKFDERGALARALILAILGELRVQRLDPPQKKRLDELEESLYHAFSVTERGPLQINWRTVVVEVLGLLLSLVKLDFVASAIRQSTGFLSRLFLWEKSDKKEKEEKQPVITSERVEKLAGILEREAVTRSILEVRSTEQFLTRYRELVAELTKPGRRLFVLIDDLDRCLPENALQVFESIRLFLDAPGCGYVVALDREVIRRGLAVRYGKTAESKIFINPDEYIEKTVSLSLDLPRLSEDDLRTIIRRQNLELTTAEEHLIIAGLGTNPRRVKRYMNSLALQLAIARVANQTSGTAAIADEDRPPFIKLSLIGYRYSPLMDAAVLDEEVLRGLQRIATQRKTKTPAEKMKLPPTQSPVPGLELTDQFWQLLEHEPDLNGGVETRLPRLIHWFRTPKVGEE